MTLKDLLKKKEKIKGEQPALEVPQGPFLSPDVPEFTFMRTTSTSQSIIEPPSFPGDPTRAAPPPSPSHLSPEQPRRKFGLRRHSNASHSRTPSAEAKGETSGANGKGESRLAERTRMHFGRTRSASSANVPDDLPDVGTGVVARNEDEEAKWEKRATMLARGNSVIRSGNTTPITELGNAFDEMGSPVRPVMSRTISVGKPKDDTDIQEAIRLHESGNLEASTKMFEKLADPNGENHPLSQVLFGLALRHGWGCEPDATRAITYLSYAASNSAEIESMALSAGMKKGGAAKGELVLAMYELANCFRNGWGIKKDPVAAKQYYETAANLGDTDAMNEVAWCYLEGFGCKKDKFKAAQFLRLAEQKGSKTLGNTWIWKDKYNPK